MRLPSGGSRLNCEGIWNDGRGGWKGRKAKEEMEKRGPGEEKGIINYSLKFEILSSPLL